MKTQTKAKFEVGQLVRICVKEDSRYNQECKVLEIGEEDGQIRTQFGWLLPEQLEAAEVKTEVDGKTAKVHLNGTTGEMAQQVLVEVPLDQLCYDLAALGADIKIAKSNAGRARKLVKDLGEKYEKLTDELESRGIKLHGEPPQLALANSLGSEETDDDEEDDD